MLTPFGVNKCEAVGGYYAGTAVNRSVVWMRWAKPRTRWRLTIGNTSLNLCAFGGSLPSPAACAKMATRTEVRGAFAFAPRRRAELGSGSRLFCYRRLRRNRCLWDEQTLGAGHRHRGAGSEGMM
jgi:hypothetical protein